MTIEIGIDEVGLSWIFINVALFSCDDCIHVTYYPLMVILPMLLLLLCVLQSNEVPKSMHDCICPSF